MFTLETSWSKKPKRDPSEDDVIQAIQHFKHDSDFLILSRAEQEYVQATPGTIEYRHEGRHYRSELPVDERSAIQLAMTAYLNGGDFTAGLRWNDVTRNLATERK